MIIIALDSVTYSAVIKYWLLNLNPARPHNLSLENKQLECRSIGTEYLSNIGALRVAGYFFLWDEILARAHFHSEFTYA